MRTKRFIPWLVAAVLLGLVVAGALRGIAARKERNTAPAPQVLILDIAPSEVFTLTRREISVGIPVSGAVQAVQSATIKARVAGELQGLSVREGDAVRAGQEVAHIDAIETQARVRQAQQQAEAARAQVTISQRQFDNNRALVAQGFISKTALDTSQASLNASKASYQAAVAAADIVRKSLADTVLRSPIDGLVSQRLVQNGERVAVEARILEIVNLAQLELQALVPAADATRVRVGQQARLSVEGASASVLAQVVRISPSAQVSSRAVPVYLAIENAADNNAAQGLREGVFLQGSLVAGTEEALAVPLDAVRTDQPEPYLQIVEDGRVARLTVQLGARTQIDGATWVAIQGAAAGAQVLAARVGALPPGTALKLPAGEVNKSGAPATPNAAVPAAR